MEEISYKINDIITASMPTHISTSNSGRTKFTYKTIEFHVVYNYFGHSINEKFSYELYRNDEIGRFERNISQYEYGSIEKIKELFPKFIKEVTSDLKYSIDIHYSMFNSIIGVNALDEHTGIL